MDEQKFETNTLAAFGRYAIGWQRTERRIQGQEGCPDRAHLRVEQTGVVADDFSTFGYACVKRQDAL